MTAGPLTSAGSLSANEQGGLRRRSEVMKITLMKSISRAVTDFNQIVNNGKSGLWSARICKKLQYFCFVWDAQVHS